MKNMDKVWKKYDKSMTSLMASMYGQLLMAFMNGTLRMVDYPWLSTHGSYKGLLKMLENCVSVLMGTICDIVLMVRIYEKDMSFIMVRYYDAMV